MTANETSVASAAQMQHLLNEQRKAQLKDPYPSLELRVDRINRMIDMVVKNQNQFVAAVMEDFENRSPMMTRSSDLMPTLDNLKHVRKHVKHWMKPEKRKSKFPMGLLGAKSEVRYLPMGIVGNISPWNFPIQLALSPMADIFGAGNRIMLKPSELSPHSSQAMAEAITANFDTTELAVVQGGPDVSAEFSKLKFDHLLFTGSTQIARYVSQTAASNLIPLTLELGGKNPVVISSSANIKLAAEKIMWAKTLNGGQICLCPDNIFIPAQHLETFLDACKNSVKKMFPDTAKDEEYTHIITQRHADRLKEMESEVRASGARVVSLSDANSQGRRILPTAVINPPSESRIFQEEVFGGLFSVFTYDNLQDVINTINEQPRPLALYYFGNTAKEIDQLTLQTTSGGMVINEMLAHIMQEDLPFGGVGDSGMGSYHGFDGFKNFSHAKAVFKQSPMDLFKILRPPYSNTMKSMISKQIK